MTESTQTRPTVPVTILTGFLGSGKTTLLNHIISATHGLRIAVLVNDFGSINIDAKLVVGVEGETVSLANGCVCCTMRDDLATETVRLLSRPEPPEYILVEASGISDPGLIAHTFLSSDLEAMVRVDSIIAVVDTDQLLELCHDDLQLAFEQIDVADIVILNKIDLVTRSKRDAVSERLRELVPGARLLPAVHARVPVELIFGVDSRRLRSIENESDDINSHSHHSYGHGFHTWHWTSDRPLSLAAFRAAIATLPATVYRAKGILQLRDYPQYKVEFQLAGKRSSLNASELWSEPSPHSELVFISSGEEESFDELQALLDGCTLEQLSEPALVNWRDKPKKKETSWIPTTI
tara:strand:- start:1608 stop:2660 length:1053 start_codon:yes stop_codon:yes gene_type:complete